MTAASLGFIDWILSGVTLANVLLAWVILRHAAKREENRIFAITCLAVALWTLTNALFRLTTSQSTAILWAQLSYAAALALGASFLHFSWIFPTRNPFIAPQRKWALWFVALLVTIASFLPGLVIQEVNLSERRILTAPGIWLIAVFMLVTTGLAFSRFWHSQARLHGSAQEQARYVLFGAGLTAVFGLFFNLFLPLFNNYQWVWAGPVCSIFFVGFSVYAIVAHHLFDIKILIRRTLVYSLLIGLLAMVFSGLEMLLTNAAEIVLGEEDAFIARLLTALIVSLGIQPVRQALERWVHKLLFRKEATRKLGRVVKNNT